MVQSILKTDFYKISFLIALFLLTSCSADFENTDVAFMPAGLCQMTCTDDATGEEYGMAFRVAAINAEGADGKDCYLYATAYYGQLDDEGNFLDDPLWTRTIEGTGDYGQNEDEAERYTLTMLPSTNTLIDDTYYFGDDVLYKLLLDSVLGFKLQNSKIYAIYNHRVDNCVLNSKLVIHAACEQNDEYAYVECEKLMDGNRVNYYDTTCTDCNQIKCDSAWADCETDINQEDFEEILDTYSITY